MCACRVRRFHTLADSSRPPVSGTKVGSMRARFAVAALALISSCGESDTSSLLRVTWEEPLVVDQLELTGTVEGDVVFGPTLRPQRAGAPLLSPQTVPVRFDPTLVGATIRLHVQARSSGAVVAEGTTEHVIGRGPTHVAALTLEARGGPDACGPCPTGTECIDGQCRCTAKRCAGCCENDTCRGGDQSAACGAGGEACRACAAGEGCRLGVCSLCPSTCDAGCCQGSACTAPSATACGTGGDACEACDLDKADRCGAAGACACGAQAPCGAGQRCVGGACVCDALSCPSGCCSQDQCQPQSTATCGVLGGSCFACDLSKSDTCAPTGACKCGGTGLCAAGQRCSGGQCVCDATSCPSGCCASGVCLAPSLTACGTGGATCATCDPATADTCANGGCACGGGAPCVPGQRCQSGQCVCDATSCPDGCCDGVQCQIGQLSACGTSGGACQACDAEVADNCASGGCACGVGPACEGGQRCLAGACVCDSVSCPGGCCDGTTCQAKSINTCGVNGSTCVACDLALADQCSHQNGQCACGGGPSCLPGQRCQGGACVCDATSCPDGCCNADRCEVRALGTCGVGGEACVSCDAQRADSCGSDGACRCGAGLMCDVGQRCLAGACICDSVSCTSGCCSGTTCQPGTQDGTCGGGGASCQDCTVTSQVCLSQTCG